MLGARTITEFNYRYADDAAAHVFVGLKLADAPRDKPAVIAELTARGYEVIDISADETAKLHVRYMVGGRAPALRDELLCSASSSPSARAASRSSSTPWAREWNITLFHYRNHGADYGRVLAGMHVPAADRAALRRPPARPRLPLRGRDDQPGVPDVPGRMGARRRAVAVRAC